MRGTGAAGLHGPIASVQPRGRSLFPQPALVLAESWRFMPDYLKPGRSLAEAPSVHSAVAWLLGATEEENQQMSCSGRKLSLLKVLSRAPGSCPRALPGCSVVQAKPEEDRKGRGEASLEAAVELGVAESGVHTAFSSTV